MLPLNPTSADLATTPWAKTLLHRPLVEIRRGLSLDFSPPIETSSVLALTAPSGKFVDIRFDLGPSPSHASIPRREPSVAGYATAGLCTAAILPGTTTGEGACPPYECVAHVRWRHVLDSSHRFGEDGADMYLLANGDVMEVGTVEIGGRTSMFKEYWVGPGKERRQSPCVVVETRGEEDGEVEGMVVRIGDYCQGIFQDRGRTQFSLERWEAVGGRGEGWVRDERSTSGSGGREVLPCRWVEEEVRQLGEKVVMDGRKWEVTEVFEGQAEPEP